MNDKSTEIQRLLDLPLDDLYLEIGTQLAGRRAFPLPPDTAIEGAKSWAESVLAKHVCGMASLKSLAKQDVPTQELILSVTGTLDLALHVLGTVPATTVAVLVVRVGLHKFCASIWAKQALAPSEPERQ